MIPEEPEVLISEEEIVRRVGELAGQVSADYQAVEELLLVGVLRGCFIFLADLSRLLTIPRRVDFMALAAYDQETGSSGAVRLIMDLRTNIEGKHVLIVEDIVDTGHTLKYLLRIIRSHGPASVRTCTLLHKADCAEVDVEIDYVGFEIGDEWVVGYGLDYAERDRTLPFIGTVTPEDR